MTKIGSPKGPNDSAKEIIAPRMDSKVLIKMENMEFDRTKKEFRRRVTMYNSPLSS
jgi:hypothetical protein